MDALERLGWACEQEYDVFGFQFAIRATSPEFVEDASTVLDRFRVRSSEPLWPVFSVVAPKPSSIGTRQFYVGYIDHRETFRYEGQLTARRALFAAVHRVGFGAWDQRRVVLDAYAVLVDGRSVLVYGPQALKRCSEIVSMASASRVTDGYSLIDIRDARLNLWPFRITERPGTVDRRGVQHAPLGDTVRTTEYSVPVSVIVKTGRGRANKQEIVADLLQSCWSSARRTDIFRGLMELVSSAAVVSAFRRRPEPLTRAVCEALRVSDLPMLTKT